MGRQFQDEVYVVANDADPKKSRGVSASDLRQHSSQEGSRSGMDEREPTECRPREERIETNGHRPNVPANAAFRGIVIRRNGPSLRRVP